MELEIKKVKMESNFNLKREAEVNLVTLNGKLLAEDEVSSITEEILMVIDSSFKNVVFDLSELNYINSSGINMFMKVITKSRVNNGEVIFSGVQGNVEKLFKIAKLNEIYTIYRSKKDALNHFK
jgi:anti-sigma B factor antagonist